MQEAIAVVDAQELTDDLIVALITAHRDLVKATLQNGQLVRYAVRVRDEIRKEAQCRTKRRSR